MSGQWVRGDAQVVAYNSDAGTIIVTDVNTGLVVDGPRPPTADELAYYHRLYPTPDNPSYDPTPRDHAFQQINQALLVLRQVTQDRVITPTEMQGAIRLVEPAVLALRDVPLMDDELIHLTVLMLSQVLFGYFYVAMAGADGMGRLVNQFIALRQDLGRLQAEFAAYKVAHP